MLKIDLLPAHVCERVETPEGRRYKTPKGLYPSVTHVLGQLPKPELEKWKEKVGEEEAERISNKSAGRGTGLHACLEAFLKGQPEPKVEEVMKIMANGIKRLMKTTVNNIRLIETPIYSDKQRLAGTPDLLAEFGGPLAIIDYKNSKKPKKEEWIDSYYMQGGSYAQMVEERYGLKPKNVVVLIGVWGQFDPQIFVKPAEECFEMFRGYMKKLVEYRRKP